MKIIHQTDKYAIAIKEDSLTTGKELTVFVLQVINGIAYSPNGYMLGSSALIYKIKDEPK